MAITTLTQLSSSLLPPVYGSKVGTLTANGNTGFWHNLYVTGGFPPVATVPSVGLNGVALTSMTGAIPFQNPPAGQNTYLAGFTRGSAGDGFLTAQRSTMLIDRLWHNSGLDTAVTTAQSLSSVQFPPRDINGTSNGEGVFVAVEVTATVNATTPTMTLGYTNSDGASGKTINTSNFYRPSIGAGWFTIFHLAAGDKGVRSIQSFTLSAAIGGSISLVAFRPIALMTSNSASQRGFVYEDALSLGLPRLYDNSVLQTINLSGGSGSIDSGSFSIQFAQG